MSVEQLLAWDEKSINQMGAFLSKKIKDCAKIDILTGYFFFDGFEGIQEALLENSKIKLRILVGMDAGIDTRGLVRMVYEKEAGDAPGDDANARDDYLATLKDILRHPVPGQVTEEQIQLWNQYAKMIEGGRLEIRKTRQPNHAKIYIFHHWASHHLHDYITYTGGSSNFSHSGLFGRHEFNIHVSTEFAEKVSKLFEELWDDAVPIVNFVEHRKTSEKVAETLYKDTPGTAIAPFDAYMKLLWEYLKLNRSDEKLENRIRGMIRDVGFDELKYQIDAVSRAKKILDSNGGVIIADVVGLGKSVIASLLAKLSDGTGVVLAPPALLEGAKGWKSYLEKFTLRDWEAFSMYDPDLASRSEVKNAWTVIIDEAHNLRNENTELYKNLQSLLAGKQVVCLSATPYNNRPEDLLALVNLFPSPQIAGVSKAEFTGKIKEICKQHKKLIEARRALTGQKLAENSKKLKELATSLRSLIYPLTIRRNRLDLEENDEYKKEVGDRMPEVKPPMNLKAELTVEQGQFYEKILTDYFAGEKPKFTGAMYRPQTYISDKDDKQTQRQTNLYSMICRFMVSRWESSPVAFYKTLENIAASLETSLKTLDKHGIFFRGVDEYDGDENDGDLPGAALAAGEYDDLINQIKKARKTLPVYVAQDAEKKVRQDLPERDIFAMSAKQLDEFKKDLQADLEVLQEIKDDFIACGLGVLNEQGKFQPTPENDGKLQALVELAGNVLRDGIDNDKQSPDNPRKIIVFSYYADTARYVHDYLEKKFPGQLLYADGGNTTKEHKQEIERHFMSMKPGDKGYEDSQAKTAGRMILVCTDVLSEGINLNQAGVVVNYDICYNPVRVIQRRGRINRIDQKVFERLYSVNFFPTTKGETINQVGDISVRKMKMIHSILGEDAIVLSDEEEPTAFLKKITDTDEIEKEMQSDETRIANLFQQGLKDKCGEDEKKKDNYKKYLDTIGRERWAITPGNSNQLYIFKQNTAAFFVTLLPDINNAETQAQQVPCFEAFNTIKCSPTTDKSLPFSATESDPFWNAYQKFIKGEKYTPVGARSTKQQKSARDIVKTFSSKELKGELLKMI